MAANRVSEYLKFANLQLASEAFLNRRGLLYTNTRGQVRDGNLLVNILQDGNEHSSKFTQAAAEQFALDWEIIAHKDNAASIVGNTGFSGTLFKARRDDPIAGTKAGDLVLSFRSTEFLDDNLRDNKASNEMELKELGWAMGQISEMEAWYRNVLRVDPNLLGGKSFSVTGYSLGGHLATAFDLLRREEAASGVSNPVTSTYTFNGAGVGGLQPGVKLTDVMNRFTSGWLAADQGDATALGLTNATVIAQFNIIRNLQFSGNAQIDAANRQLLDDAMAALYVNPAPGQIGSFPVPVSSEVPILADAIGRVKRLLDEKTRVDGLGINTFADGTPPIGLQASVGYQLAALRASELTIPSSVPGYRALPFSDSLSLGGVNNLPLSKKGPPDGTPKIENMYEINGLDGGQGGASFVSFSGLHYGEDVPLYIEDQPLNRGTITTDMFNVLGGASLFSPTLLVRNPGQNDFGDTQEVIGDRPRLFSAILAFP